MRVRVRGRVRVRVGVRVRVRVGVRVGVRVSVRVRVRVRVRERERVRVRVRVRACMRACVRACLRACVCLFFSPHNRLQHLHKTQYEQSTLQLSALSLQTPNNKANDETQLSNNPCLGPVPARMPSFLLPSHLQGRPNLSQNGYGNNSIFFH